MLCPFPRRLEVLIRKYSVTPRQSIVSVRYSDPAVIGFKSPFLCLSLYMQVIACVCGYNRKKRKQTCGIARLRSPFFVPSDVSSKSIVPEKPRHPKSLRCQLERETLLHFPVVLTHLASRILLSTISHHLHSARISTIYETRRLKYNAPFVSARTKPIYHPSPIKSKLPSVFSASKTDYRHRVPQPYETPKASRQ